MNHLKGKKIFFIGDSIMAQDGHEYDYQNILYNHDKLGEICRGYPTLIEEQTGMETVKNTAVGGHGINDQKSIVVNEDLSCVDITVIAVGINDFSRGTIIGDMPDTNTVTYDDTFIGAFCELMDYIYKQNPLMKVVLMTPMHKDTTHRKGDVPKHDISSVNKSGCKIFDYVEAIRKIGAFYSCPVADMYSESGFNRFNLPLLTFEGTHPTNEGYEYIIKVLIDTLNKLY